MSLENKATTISHKHLVPKQQIHAQVTSQLAETTNNLGMLILLIEILHLYKAAEYNGRISLSGVYTELRTV